MKRYGLWIALFISLALNVFVVGAFVGSRLGGGRGGPSAVGVDHTLRARNPIAAAVRELPPEAQARWREQMPSFNASYGPRMREARRLARETLRDFGQDPFDPVAARAELARSRALEQEGRIEMDRRLVAFATTLSAQDRARFGAALARSRPGAGQRGRPHRPQDPVGAP